MAGRRSWDASELSNIETAQHLGSRWAGRSAAREHSISCAGGWAAENPCPSGACRNSLIAQPQPGMSSICFHAARFSPRSPPRRSPRCWPRPAFAAYPDQPIRLIVPFAAGGNADLVARLVAEGMSPSLGQIDRRRKSRRRGRQPRRRPGGDGAARRLHAAHRLERAADRQPVRAGQAQLRSAQGFRRGRARQPGAARHRAERRRSRRRPCRSWWRCRRRQPITIGTSGAGSAAT